MALVGSILSWIFSILLSILALSMFLTRNIIRGIVLLVAILLLLSPIQMLIQSLSGQTIPPLVRIVGASNGGFLALNYAIHYPDRINKMTLLGSMGLTPSTNENIMRITFSQMFPLKWVQDNTIQWSFGDDPGLLAQIEDWFRLVFQTAPQQSPPITMKAEELQQVRVPTLAVLGTEDHLMGDLAKVRDLASNVPGIEIVEIEASHLMGMEEPEKCNQLILEFFGSN
jgi:pimeloyl-ACP methyl ester carboxylesterase